MDATFPGKVHLGKVKFNAAYPHEVTANYKHLQQIFSRCGVQKDIDVERLTKGRFLDNLEFLQWIKYYHDTHTTLAPGEYRAHERRRTCGCEEPAGSGKLTSKRATQASAPPSTAAPKRTRTAPPPARSAAPVQQAPARTPAPAQPAPPPPRPPVPNAALEEAHRQLEELQHDLEGMEKERNFYYRKLLEVEEVCKTTVAEQSERDADAGTSTTDDPIITVMSRIIDILFVPPHPFLFVTRETDTKRTTTWRTMRPPSDVFM